MSAKHITSDLDDKLRNYVNSNLTAQQIADQIGCTKHNVYKRMTMLGLRRKGGVFTNEDEIDGAAAGSVLNATWWFRNDNNFKIAFEQSGEKWP